MNIIFVRLSSSFLDVSSGSHQLAFSVFILNFGKPLIVNHFRPVGTPQSLLVPVGTTPWFYYIVVIVIAKEDIVFQRLLT